MGGNSAALFRGLNRGEFAAVRGLFTLTQGRNMKFIQTNEGYIPLSRVHISEGKR